MTERQLTKSVRSYLSTVKGIFQVVEYAKKGCPTLVILNEVITNVKNPRQFCFLKNDMIDTNPTVKEKRVTNGNN